jgi:hypothetical protein
MKSSIFIYYCSLIIPSQLPNGWRYPLVGGTRQRHFAGTHFKPRKLLKNAPTPTSRVHAVLGSISLASFFVLNCPQSPPVSR